MLFSLFSQKSDPVDHPPLRGVNLGGWLVLEKWITPSLFEGLEANDEYSLLRLGNDQVPARLRRHRDQFITRDDFVWLRDHGIEAVRLPVGYWAFGDVEPYAAAGPAIDYVDQAFAWAAETGIYILLDIHAAPGSQNGWDHSGRAGHVGWADDEQHIISTLEFASRLAKRYARHPRLLGIELLNEPKWTLPKAALKKYYQAAYKLIRSCCGPNIWIVFSDNFRPRRWKRELRGAAYRNVVMDTHQYQTFNARDKKLDIHGHLTKTARTVPAALADMRSAHHIMVGEWSLTLDAQSLAGLDASQLAYARQAYAAAQLLAYSQSSAWFYWTYRTESGGPWSFRESVEQGWLPDFAALPSRT